MSLTSREGNSRPLLAEAKAREMDCNKAVRRIVAMEGTSQCHNVRIAEAL